MTHSRILPIVALKESTRNFEQLIYESEEEMPWRTHVDVNPWLLEEAEEKAHEGDPDKFKKYVASGLTNLALRTCLRNTSPSDKNVNTAMAGYNRATAQPGIAKNVKDAINAKVADIVDDIDTKFGKPGGKSVAWIDQKAYELINYVKRII